MEELLKSKWDEILNYLRIEYEIGEISFKTWIQALSIYSVQDHHIVIAIDDAKIGTNKEYIMSELEKNGQINLTEMGHERATAIYERHCLIKEFLIKTLQIDESLADKDACRIEHVISEETFNRMKELLKK